MSSSNAIAIRAEGLAKAYTLGETAPMFAMARRRVPTVHWALDGVDFEVFHGEAIGIIGHNGAGKSTLLKLLSRVTEPTRGVATIYGRVASLLEVGTGFHPELTGRENIYMNGSILGMRRAEVTRHFQEIVEFAGVEKFVETPVKRYSSGMHLRLAFSVAAHLQPEILIVDEVLAVGDVQFQKKCMGKMDDVSRSGRTVLFVSHNMAAVRQLTSRCILLNHGKVAFDGSSERAIELYSEVVSGAFRQGADLSNWPRKLPVVDRLVEFRSLHFESDASVFAPGESIRFIATLVARDSVSGVRVSGSVLHPEGYSVGTFWTTAAAALERDEVLRYVIDLGDLRLAPGAYSLQLALGTGSETTGHRDFDVIREVLPFEVASIEGEGGVTGAWHPTWGSVRFQSATLVQLKS
jgi:lipopolysaccharide transport system ATP-binding protein